MVEITKSIAKQNPDQHISILIEKNAHPKQRGRGCQLFLQRQENWLSSSGT